MKPYISSNPTETERLEAEIAEYQAQIKTTKADLATVKATSPAGKAYKNLIAAYEEAIAIGPKAGRKSAPMLTNRELIEAVISGRNAANDLLFHGENTEEARAMLNGKHYDLTDGLYSTPFVFGFHMVMIEEEAPQ